ncbi:AI-2E family transporter [Winogradskyella aurantiaca]|uniref:AI-2E family transporter n=1 Tax=Winogradskyella aurantiaca TaxID=2219558 RepID=UPI000E1E2025|nr:AI-2E family transporter [Winogradskyella aurantiaca]
MDSKTITKGILNAVYTIAGIVAFAYFLYLIQSVILYILMAAITSLTGRPIVILLRRHLKFGNGLAVITTMILLFGFLLGVLGLFIPLMIEQGQNLALLDITRLEGNVERLFDEAITYLQIENIDLEGSFKDFQLFSNVDFSYIPDFLNTLFSGLGSFSVGLFSVLFISFFFLMDANLVESVIVSIVPIGQERKTRHSIMKIKNLLSRYFAGLFMQISILFVIYTVTLLIVGIQHPIVIAFLCALLNLIPYVGPLISAVLMAILTMSSNIGQSFSEVILPKTLYVMVGFGIGQFIDNFFSQPFIFSRSVNSHPLEIFLVILIAGMLTGPIGMVAAIPFYTAVKVILKEFMSDNKFVRKLTKNL